MEQHKTFQLVATTLYGLEDVLVQELENIGAQNVQKQKRAVTFEGDLHLLYKANIQLRTAIRILKYVTSFTYSNVLEIYQKLDKIIAFPLHELYS